MLCTHHIYIVTVLYIIFACVCACVQIGTCGCCGVCGLCHVDTAWGARCSGQLPVWVSVWQSDSLTVLLSDCLLVCFSLCLSACLAVRLSVILSACLAFLRDCRGVTAIQLPVHNCRGVSGVVWRRGHTRQVERGRKRGTEGLRVGKGYSSVIVHIVNGL